ncbi:SPASM domain-containing protein, partial [Candidatus Bathyarchaeota archaeon]|nr:SPASM domain-containing protein [Candidatus Bathyarchaeota archaeon]
IYYKIYNILSDISSIKDRKISEKGRLGIWEKAIQKKLSINLPLLFKSKERLLLLNQVENYFRMTEKITRKYNIELKLPTIFPDAKERLCPYIEKNALFIRSDGKVSPCMEFAYPHSLYINMHQKLIHPIIFGDLLFEELKYVWNKPNYKAFRNTRRNVSQKIPWCGDCVFSPWCFFSRSNERDCFTNEPGCSECLYSIGLSICNI